MRIVLPLRQHVGAPCQSIVEAGDEVKRGQLIAKPTGLGANIHASVNGEVVEVTEQAIVIESKGEVIFDDYVRLTGEDHLELIAEAGIVGAGGAGFPAHVKFKANLEGGYVIANAAECEPLLKHNMKLLRDNPELVVRGIKYVMDITGASHGYIAIKPKHKEEMIALAKACKGYEGIELKYLPDMYPAGDERVIVREILGVELPLGALPSEAKAVISNVETLKNVTRAIEDKMPVINKDLTVTGRVNDEKVFMDIPLGTSIKGYIEESGGYLEPHGEIVAGGPFTGKHAEEDDPVVKTLGGIIVTMPFPQDARKFGFLECECGAQKDRLTQIAEGMGVKEIVGSVRCKRMEEIGDTGRFRCTLPGHCPGQAEKVLELKKMGAEAIIVGTCED
ncbi:MAG: proline reductase-associated electron transfer protein PrdC [Tissierellia bacterium]|nr:proline reductase-associated electron transfer protein PrdC [Tissierellia bacterium]